MKVSTIFLAFAVAVSAAPLPASAEILQGLRFVTAMKDNTLSGKTAAGTAYNVYFLPPAWRPIPMPRARVTTVAGSSTATADVCVSWHGTVATSQGCFRVTADGRNLSWEQKSTQTG